MSTYSESGNDEALAISRQASPLVLPDGQVALRAVAESGQCARPSLDAALEAGMLAVPGARHASIRVRDSGGASRLLLATTEAARRLDDLQTEAGDGPSSAVLRGQYQTLLVREGDEMARQWPRLSRHLRCCGLESLIACQLAWEDRPLGVLTLGLEERMDASHQAAVSAAALAEHVAATIGLSQQVAQLKKALVTRQEIGQAVGILMERYRLGPESAFAYLRRLSQNENTKLRDLAETLRLTGRLPGQDGRRDEPT